MPARSGRTRQRWAQTPQRTLPSGSRSASRVGTAAGADDRINGLTNGTIVSWVAPSLRGATGRGECRPAWKRGDLVLWPVGSDRDQRPRVEGGGAMSMLGNRIAAGSMGSGSDPSSGLPEPVALDAETAAALLRIAREAVTAAATHRSATIAGAVGAVGTRPAGDP